MKQRARHVAESLFIMIALLKDKNEKWNANKEETLI